MGYSRPHVKEALLAARRDGKSTEGLMVGDRETEIVLERLGYLPIDQDAVDERVRDWYVSQGLVLREQAVPAAEADTPDAAPSDTPADTPADTPERSAVALEAAEAALAAAAAALRLARLSA